MLHKIFSLLLVTVFISCSENDITIPDSVIPPDSMIVILADIHIAESRLIQHGYKPDNPTFKSSYLRHVMESAGTDSVRFNHSFLFYSSNPGYFREMYEDVITEISKKQGAGSAGSAHFDRSGKP